MTSPEPKSPNQAGAEGGGLLPAVLAGAGILLVAGLFIFGGDDEKTANQAKDGATANASAHSARSGQPGVASRQVDDATKTSKPRPKLNPRIANAVVTEGMAPSPSKQPEPTSFESTAEEIAYWEKQLSSAESTLEMRQRAVDYAPTSEEGLRKNGTAEDLALFQKRLVIVNDNLAKAKARVAEIEAKLEALR
jgi:hypothetical protein